MPAKSLRTTLLPISRQSRKLIAFRIEAPLHAIIKSEAKKRNISIAKYTAEALVMRFGKELT